MKAIKRVERREMEAFLIEQRHGVQASKAERAIRVISGQHGEIQQSGNIMAICIAV